MKITPEIILADLKEVIDSIPSEMQITIALRYGDGPRELKDTIARVRNKLEALKGKVLAK